MESKDYKQKRIKVLKQDLGYLKEDWRALLKESTKASDPTFLKKVARDIKLLDQEAQSEESAKACPDEAHMIHYLLSTPWGAPFVGEKTLLEAAEDFEKHPSTDGALNHLMKDFSNYGKKFDFQLFRIFEDISEDLEKK